jgi:DNA polymerase III subunit epsilon
MSRKIILDTETTGISHKKGHRIIEVGCIEVLGRTASSKHFHKYTNPLRAVDPGAFAVHGISDDFLSDKPLFADIAYELWEFLIGAELIIHNASFDIGFLDAEFARLKMPGGRPYAKLKDVCTVTDTLAMARKMHPGMANSLDALCKRYKVDASNRELHGALLDSELLLQVYLAMTGGQMSLLSETDSQANAASKIAASANINSENLKVVLANATELQAHDKFMQEVLS